VKSQTDKALARYPVKTINPMKTHLLFFNALTLALGLMLCAGCGPGPRCTLPAKPGVTSAPGTDAPVKVSLKFVKADSEETSGENGKGANAVDGDTTTIWHTQWQGATPPCPHEITIELIPPASIKGFTYLPRQDDSENGTIKDYEFYVSSDGDEYGLPVAKGTFEAGKDLRTVKFAPQKCRFIRLKALSEINDGPWTSAAEIGVVQ
jgi:alpha-glucosidase